MERSDDRKYVCCSQAMYTHTIHITQNRLGATSLSGGVLPLMAYMGWLHPKGVPFLGFDYMKGNEFL